MCKQTGRILSFWIDEIGPEGWYRGDLALDNEIRTEFEGVWREAMAGDRCNWLTSPDTALALLVLLDQFPRNMFRGSAKAFSSDAAALSFAKRAIVMGHDLKVPEPQRQFFYLPLMHSESLMDQERCVRLMAMRMPAMGADNLRHARAHRDAIRRFGRFPTRNEALGRMNTPAEQSYLDGGGYAASLEADAA